MGAELCERGLTQGPPCLRTTLQPCFCTACCFIQSCNSRSCPHRATSQLSCLHWIPFPSSLYTADWGFQLVLNWCQQPSCSNTLLPCIHDSAIIYQFSIFKLSCLEPINNYSRIKNQVHMSSGFIEKIMFLSLFRPL